MILFMKLWKFKKKSPDKIIFWLFKLFATSHSCYFTIFEYNYSSATNFAQGMSCVTINDVTLNLVCISFYQIFDLIRLQDPSPVVGSSYNIIFRCQHQVSLQALFFFFIPRKALKTFYLSLPARDLHFQSFFNSWTQIFLSWNQAALLREIQGSVWLSSNHKALPLWRNRSFSYKIFSISGRLIEFFPEYLYITFRRIQQSIILKCTTDFSGTLIFRNRTIVSPLFIFNSISFSTVRLPEWFLQSGNLPKLRACIRFNIFYPQVLSN